MRNRQKDYQTRREKVVDFIIGFVGWFILNGVLLILPYVISGGFGFFNQAVSAPDLTQIINDTSQLIGILLVCAPLIINLVLLIFFAFTRYWIAIGGASAFASVLVLTICAGIVWTVACFAILANTSP